MKKKKIIKYLRREKSKDIKNKKREGPRNRPMAQNYNLSPRPKPAAKTNPNWIIPINFSHSYGSVRLKLIVKPKSLIDFWSNNQTVHNPKQMPLFGFLVIYINLLLNLYLGYTNMGLCCVTRNSMHDIQIKLKLIMGQKQNFWVTNIWVLT